MRCTATAFDAGRRCDVGGRIDRCAPPFACAHGSRHDERATALRQDRAPGRGASPPTAWTTSTSADPSRADASFALAKRASKEAYAGRSVVVRSGRLPATRHTLATSWQRSSRTPRSDDRKDELASVGSPRAHARKRCDCRAPSVGVGGGRLCAAEGDADYLEGQLGLLACLEPEHLALGDPDVRADDYERCRLVERAVDRGSGARARVYA
jgi:hypothetical protein